MKTKKYAIFEPNLIFNGIKYQVGKRYKKDKFLFSDKDIRILFLDYLIKADLIKQIEIRIIYEYDDYYIIHNEINYYEDFNSNFELEFKNLFLLLRYRDKNIINKNIDSMSIYEKIALAIVGNRSHIKKLIQWAKNQTIKYFDLDILNYHILKNINKNDYLELQPINDNLKEAFKIIGFKEINKILEEDYILYNEAIANLGYDKYLDCFINNKKCLDNEILVSAILDKGRHKDLDFFMNNSEDLFIAELIINCQREKDLIKLSKSKNKEISWLANKELNEIKFI